MDPRIIHISSSKIIRGASSRVVNSGIVGDPLASWSGNRSDRPTSFRVPATSRFRGNIREHNPLTRPRPIRARRSILENVPQEIEVIIFRKPFEFDFEIVVEKGQKVVARFRTGQQLSTESKHVSCVSGVSLAFIHRRSIGAQAESGMDLALHICADVNVIFLIL